MTTTALDTTTLAPQTPAPTAATETRFTLENAVDAAREHARRLTALYGTGSIDVALAWENYGELRRVQVSRATEAKTPFQRYCERYPDAPEARCYDV